jgi:LuxR family maltose regulon positive regulatory protein
MRTVELLQPKLQRPRVPRYYLPRPRLIERLDEGAQGPLTLVCAGAGYGKTTLVCSWIESRAARNGQLGHEHIIWLSLDERDSDLDVFLRYLIAGLRTAFSGACPNTSALLLGTMQAPFDVLAATVINEIAGLPDDFVLVLDNYHLVGGTAVPDFFGELERHWPQSMHLVLLSRYAPPLSLATLRARGLLTEIRTRDLRFTHDEIGEYLLRAAQAPLSPSGINSIERRTEGWVAGLQLVSIAMRNADDPDVVLASLAGLQTDFADYVASELLAHQPAPVRSFLLETSILEDFSIELCDDVLEAEDPEWSVRRCIDWIESRNLFVTSLDSRREWYRYHQMFRSALLERAQAELGPERVSDIQRSAANWFTHRGLVDEAVSHALAAGDRELASYCVANGLCEVLNRQDRATLERWLSLFPDEFIQTRLELMIVRCMSLHFSWQLGAFAKALPQMLKLLEQPVDSPPGFDPNALRGCAHVVAGVDAYLRDDPASSIAYVQDVLTLLPEEWSFIRGLAVLAHGLSMQALGQGAAAVRQLADGYEILRDRSSTYALRHLQSLSYIYYVEGEDLELVQQTAQKLTEESERKTFDILLSWGLLMQGLAHSQRNELADARQNLARLLQLRYSGNMGALRAGISQLALVEHSLGEDDAVSDRLQLLRQFDLDQFGRESDETRSLRARIALARGDAESAVRWADSYTASVPKAAWPWQNPPHLYKARILLARGAESDLRSALEILEELLERASRRYNARLQIEILALRALVLDGMRRPDEALSALQTAVELARPGGFLRPFVDLGSPMREALNRLARRADARLLPTLRVILGQFGEPATSAAAPGEAPVVRPGDTRVGPVSEIDPDLGPLVEPLTGRELEILRLLREPLSAKEIARQLCISYHTVKRHTINIYAKLSVNKRWAAVARAEALGLLPPR